MSRTYPEKPAGEFPVPPATVTDGEGREIDVVPADADDTEALVGMYLDFDPSDRAQGIPPVREDRIRDWLDRVLAPECLNVVARHGDRVVGHATLVPDGDAYELAIFVAGAYQNAGIGTELVTRLLGLAREEGVERIWLSVERWNRAAVALYRKVGFEVCNAEGFEIEMSIRL